MIVGDFELSINIAKEAIDLFEELSDHKGIANAKYTIAGALYKTDEYYEGLTCLVDCLAIYRKLDDHHNIARVLKSMGTIYEYFGDINKARSSYEEAIAFGKRANDTNLQSNAFNPLSGIYLNEGKIDVAKELIEESIAMKTETKDTRGLAFALYGRGKVYTQTKEYELAEKDFIESIAIHEEAGEKLGWAMSQHKLGALYILMNRLDEAKEILIKVLAYSNKNRIILIKFKANWLLHEIAKKEGDHELALKYMTQYIEEKEGVINERTAKVMEVYNMANKVKALEVEAEIQKEKAEIHEKKNLELDSFFYRISHDLKGPITSMLSLGYVAQHEVKDETAKTFFKEYDKNANRLNNILDELLKLTKLTYEVDSKEIIDFEKIILDCINSYKYLENYDKVNFSVQVENVTYNAEWSLVNTIIQNLIENGIKYARLEDNSPAIYLTVARKDENILIIVKDNGIGMDEETVEKIFSMFFRVNRTIDGTGLGLHILKRAVEKLDGKVKVESALGKGTTFTVTLPIV
ncbi:MAG: hypothetical protein Tsb0034_04480 [Ekhidna sp.]